MSPVFRHATERSFWRPLHAIAAFALSACTTTGGNAILKALAVDPCYDPIGEGRVLIWSSEPEIATALEEWAKRHDLTVVEHPDMREPVWDRRRQRVIPADDVLRDLAKSYGAQRVLIATAEKNAHPLYYRYAGYSEGPPSLTTIYDPTITIRSLGSHEAIVYWTAIAGDSSTTFFWGRGLGEIVDAALHQVEARGEANGREKKSCSQMGSGALACSELLSPCLDVSIPSEPPSN
jgi:hypothetical protein